MSRVAWTFQFLICTLMIAITAQEGMPQHCKEQNLPITVGGSRDDIATCLVFDPNSQLIITGGVTRSSDFGPSNLSTGFLYAVNLNGDWVWGNYFLNQSQRIQRITGCQMSSNGESVIILGTTDYQVVMGVVNGKTGKISFLYGLEEKGRSEELPSYSTFGAVMLDSNDGGDGKAYLYTSFLMEERQQLVKISQAVPDRSNEFPELQYHYSFVERTSVIAGDDRSRSVPQFMFSFDTNDRDRDSFYISGTYRGVGSIMKFYKRNAALRWHAQLDMMTSVAAIAERDQGASSRAHFYACGHDSQDERGTIQSDRTFESQAWFFSMDGDGEANWMLKLSGASLSAGDRLSNSCQGLVYESSRDMIVSVIETNSPQFKVDRNSKQRDTMLLEINSNGKIQKVMTFSLGENRYDMLGFPQNLILTRDGDIDRFYMSGGLYGFKTQRQKYSYNSVRERDLDIFLFPMTFVERPSNFCFDEKKLQARDIIPFGNLYNSGQARSMYQFQRDNDREVPKQRRGSSVFQVNYSKFSMARQLKSFIKTPRPCAYQSLQLVDKPEEYYRASEAMVFNIAERTSYGSIITQMNRQAGGQNFIIDKSGEVTTQAAFVGTDGGKIGFFWQAVDQIGLHELTIRHCDRLERLFDLRLQVDVKRNSQPVFIDSPQTAFELKYGQTQVYRLPDTVDPEGNAEAQIIIRPYTGYVDFFPPFLTVFNGNRTFEFNVNKEEYAGKEYFFKVVLKEAGGKAVGIPYYFQIFIESLPAQGKGEGGSSGGESNPESNGSSGNSQDQSATDGSTDNEPEDGQQPVDDTTGTEKIVIPEFSVKREGSVITKNTFQSQQVDEWLIVEMYTTDIIGRTQIKFICPVYMDRIEDDFVEMFNFSVLSYKSIDVLNDWVHVEYNETEFTNFNATNQTIDVHFHFDEPFRLGLNTEKSDYVIMELNQTYPWYDVIQKDTVKVPEGKTSFQKKARARIELTFDYENQQMKNSVIYAEIFLYIFISLVFFQVLLLLYKNVGLLTFWIFFDYAQLIAYLPLTSSRCPPWVYEAFRPFLATHMLFKYPGDPGLETLVHDEYLNLSFRAYSIKQDELLQMALIFVGILCLIIATDIAVSCLVTSTQCCKEGCFHKLLLRLQSQFRYNIYIRFLMVCYLDAVFITGIMMADSENTLHWSSALAYLILVITSIIPLFITIFLCTKFDSLKEKQGKENFNTLLLKVDKEDRMRIFLPAFFFFRRFATALVLVLGASQQAPAYLQFVVMIAFSASLLFYMANTEPYVQRRYSSFVFLMEMIYFLLIMTVFVFTDATDTIQLKLIMAYSCLILLAFFFVINIIMAIYFMYTGRETLRQKDRDAKDWRRNQQTKKLQEVQHQKDKRKRKKAADLNQMELTRKAQLEQVEAKREELRGMGYQEEEILAKHPHEPVQESGFQFGAVMGKRLIDYGIMSSSTDSEDEQDFYTQAPLATKVETEMTEMDQVRRESLPISLQDLDNDYSQDYTSSKKLVRTTSQFGQGGVTDPGQPSSNDHTQNEATLTPMRHLFQQNNLGSSDDFSGDYTGRTALPRNDGWVDRIMQNDQAVSEQIQRDSLLISQQQSSSKPDLDDDYDGENLATERRLITNADDQEDDDFLNAQPGINTRRRTAREEDYSPERDGHPRFQSQMNVNFTNHEDLSSRANILNSSQRQDDQIRHLADSTSNAR